MTEQPVVPGTEGKASAFQVAADAATKTIAAAERVAAAQHPYLRRKQLWTLGFLDADQDGVVAPDDMMQFAHRLASSTGHDENSPRAQQLVDTVNKIWDTFVATPAWVPDPQRLSSEQFVTVMANSVSETPDKTLQYIGLATNLAFAMADSDNDGLLDKEEAVRLSTQVLGADQQNAERAWSVLDDDDDGYLSYAECLDAVTDFVVRPDPSAPGNRAFGPPDE